MTSISRLVAVAVLLGAPAAFAQQSATVSSVSASARIYKPITLTLTTGTSLGFGDIFLDAASGTVTLNPKDGSRTSTLPAANLVTDHASNVIGVPEFTVGGKRNASYAITLPADGTVTLTGPNSATMTVGSFKASVNGGDPAFAATGLIPDTAGGTQKFKVGATLSLAAGQADGDYTGTFPVTVTYN